MAVGDPTSPALRLAGNGSVPVDLRPKSNSGYGFAPSGRKGKCGGLSPGRARAADRRANGAELFVRGDLQATKGTGMSDREQRWAAGEERLETSGTGWDDPTAAQDPAASPAGDWAGDPPGEAPAGGDPWTTAADMDAGVAAPAAAVPPVRERLFSPRWLGGAAGAAVVFCGAIFFLAVRQALLGRLSLLEPRTLICLGAAGLATLGLAALAWWSVQSLAARTQGEHDRLRGVIDHVAGLGFDSEFGWQDGRLSEEPELARFLQGLQARDREQRQELARGARLEIEIGRLGAALLAKDRGGVTASYAQPAAERLAAGAALLYEEIDRWQREAVQAQARLEELGGQALAALDSARRWQACAQSQLAAQLESVRAQAADAQRLGGTVEERAKALEEARRRGAPTAATVLAAMPALSAGERAAALTQAAHTIKDLVARGGSLAIQTALEVTRLGERGETLFPLTESLKALVTDFQGMATQLEKLARDQEAAQSALGKVQALLGELQDAPERDAAAVETWRDLAARVGEFKLALVRLGADIGGALPGYAEQAERLDGAGGALAELTGQPLPEIALAAPPAAGQEGFQIESFAAPRLQRATPTPVADASSAAAAPVSPAAPALFVKDESEREQPTRPAAFEPMGLTERRSQAPAAGPAMPAAAAGLPASPAAPPAIPAETPPGLRAAPAAPDLSEADDRVYDLAEFGAVALDGEPEAAPEDEERVYDLSEFGAVALA